MTGSSPTGRFEDGFEKFKHLGAAVMTESTEFSAAGVYGFADCGHIGSAFVTAVSFCNVTLLDFGTSAAEEFRSKLEEFKHTGTIAVVIVSVGSSAAEVLGFTKFGEEERYCTLCTFGGTSATDDGESSSSSGLNASWKFDENEVLSSGFTLVSSSLLSNRARPGALTRGCGFCFFTKLLRLSLVVSQAFYPSLSFGVVYIMALSASGEGGVHTLADVSVLRMFCYLSILVLGHRCLVDHPW